MPLVTPSEFSRRIGVSPQAVHKGLQNGRIRYAPGTRKLDLEPAERDWRANAGRLAHPHGAATSKNGKAGAADTEKKRGDAGRRETLMQVSMVKMAAEASLRRLQVDRMTGKLINRELVVSEVYRWFRQERDAWIAWPERFGNQIVHELAQVGAEVPLRELTIILNRFIRQYLDELGRIDPPAFTE